MSLINWEFYLMNVKSTMMNFFTGLNNEVYIKALLQLITYQLYKSTQPFQILKTLSF